MTYITAQAETWRSVFRPYRGHSQSLHSSSFPRDGACANSPVTDINADKLGEPTYIRLAGHRTNGKMEVDGMIEIFKRSEEKYQVLYTGYIGDGDSKTFQAIAEAKPYNDCAVEK